MPTATIVPAYVNPVKPGKKLGSVKDRATGAYYGVPPQMLGQFSVGGTYNIEFTEREFNGATYRTVTKVQQQAAAPASSGGAGGNTYRETSNIDAKRMWMTACVRAGIQSGQVQMSAEALEIAGIDALTAWDKLQPLLTGKAAATTGVSGSGGNAVAATGHSVGASGSATGRANALDDEIPF